MCVARRILILLPLLIFSLPAVTVNFSQVAPVAAYRSNGLYNLNGTQTWNGAPLSDTNRPDASLLGLSASFNFYRDGLASNVLYLQVTDVVTTQGASWFGEAAQNVTLTGLQITNTGIPVAQVAGFSGALANPGQVLALGTATDEYDFLLTTTPGYLLTASNDSLLVRTVATDGSYGFTSLGVRNAIRIRGGGVFALLFAPGVNVSNFDFAAWNVAARYGNDSQFVGAALVPEPGAWGLVGVALLVGVLARKRASGVRGGMAQG